MVGLRLPLCEIVEGMTRQVVALDIDAEKKLQLREVVNGGSTKFKLPCKAATKRTQLGEFI